MLGKEYRERKFSILGGEDGGEQSNDMYDLWRTMEAVAPLTPPLSPKGEEFTHTFLIEDDKCANCVKNGHIIKDCMFSWEKDMKDAPEPPKCSNCTCSRRNRDYSFSGENCVAPTAVFPSCCIQEKPKTEIRTPFTLKFVNVETPNMTSESESENSIQESYDTDPEEENDDEIDVVSVTCNDGVDEDMLEKGDDWNSNSGASLSATVAAMHNYTQQMPKKAMSMPPSPALQYDYERSTRPAQSSRKIFSSPTSPVHKRSRRKLTTNDLYRVAKQIRRANRNEERGKRAQHNTLERQRRIDLRMSFEHLKNLVPTPGKERMSKVNILKFAAQYCKSLTKKQETLEAQMKEEQEKNNKLRRRLSELRSGKSC
ncbi:DgyrCDS1203 [Dimorphilus gyrociliatus]|uniref:DgyrCDS1203 n=1 Tax=Dimorphilus gyrociliatus TaxID=2664684 RepID=A0A7I8V9G3_9ANNE|nr:DgyrCDS1203 [Dimorphilus gyrociliatus]